MIILWDWDKLKIKSKVNIGIHGIPQSIGKAEDEIPNTFQISFCANNDSSILVTGPDTFKLYKFEGDQLEAEVTQIKKDPADLTSRYSCHTWMHDGRLILCTEVGEILILEDDGAFVCYLPDSPMQEDDFKIECIQPMKTGFMVGGNGRIYMYEKMDDARAPYKQMTEPLDVVLDSKETSFGNTGAKLITSMCLSLTEDHIFMVTANNQIMKVEVPLYDNSESRGKFEFVQCGFHSQEITGLDICIRKQLVVTCSKDRSVKIWNYYERTLEFSHILQEDALAVAFHPSGFHVIVAVPDKIYLMNVLSKSLSVPFKSIQIKHCNEVQFCNGGHLFAATQGNNQI